MQPLAKGNKTLIVTTSGGAGALTMDAIGENGLTPAAIPQELIEDLKRNVTGFGANYSNPMDFPFIDIEYWRQAWMLLPNIRWRIPLYFQLQMLYLE
jgi:acyl-CoA synthetase (NDP forming)